MQGFSGGANEFGPWPSANGRAEGLTEVRGVEIFHGDGDLLGRSACTGREGECGDWEQEEDVFHSGVSIPR